MSSRYEWKSPVKPKVPAPVARRELERVRRQHGGALRPADVVEAARDTSNPLHEYFEWDDTEAARLWREEQARFLIRTVQIVRQDGDAEPVRTVAYVHVRDPEAGPCYLPSEDAIRSPELREQVMADCVRLLTGIQRRFSQLRSLDERIGRVFEAIDQLRPPAEPGEESARGVGC